jgi:hypothetical protein
MIASASHPVIDGRRNDSVCEVVAPPEVEVMKSTGDTERPLNPMNNVPPREVLPTVTVAVILVVTVGLLQTNTYIKLLVVCWTNMSWYTLPLLSLHLSELGVTFKPKPTMTKQFALPVCISTAAVVWDAAPVVVTAAELTYAMRSAFHLEKGAHLMRSLS